MDNDKKISVFNTLLFRDNYSEIIALARKEGFKIFGCTCPVIPPEIPAAFNIMLLKIPGFLTGSSSGEIYDAIILPEGRGVCSVNPFPGIKEFRFSLPSGWGEDASVAIHNSFEKMLRETAGLDIKKINIEELKKRTAIYESLRRTVRGICAALNEKPGIMTNAELSPVFESALCLPPGHALDLLTPVLQWARSENAPSAGEKISAMLYGGRVFPWDIADRVENCGIHVAEDDSCAGRRCFDMSVNAGSDYLFYELLDAYSYRPLTPCLRTQEERYELLYKLLKNHGIETVIFYRGEDCSIYGEQVDFLRVRMMRDGVDPLEINDANCAMKVREYLERY